MKPTVHDLYAVYRQYSELEYAMYLDFLEKKYGKEFLIKLHEDASREIEQGIKHLSEPERYR